MENKQNNNWIKNCLGYSNNKYTTPAGNGEKEPQYKFNENSGKMEILLDKNGKPKTFNRYLKIQQQKNSTDYKKLIENLDFDLENVNFILNSQNPKYEWEQAIDFTNFGGIETLKSMENKIVNTFGSLEKFNKFCDEKFNKYKKQIKRQAETIKKLNQKKENQMEKEKAEFEAWKKAKNGGK